MNNEEENARMEGLQMIWPSKPLQDQECCDVIH